jgi:hypothetical protein
MACRKLPPRQDIIEALRLQLAEKTERLETISRAAMAKEAMLREMGDVSARKRQAAEAQVAEARGIILELYKDPCSQAAQAKAVRFLNNALCQEKVDRAHYDRETCGHVIPCPMHKPVSGD